MDSTARLVLLKPNSHPVTGDPVDVDVINGNMDKIDSTLPTTLCTSSTRPGSPFQGQLILETDTGRMYVRLGSSWVQLMLSAGATGAFLSHIESQRPTLNDVVLRHKLSGDTQYRVQLFGDGMIRWGDGVAAQDTNLYRAGTNLLKTDDNFQVAGTFNSHLTAFKTGNETRVSNTTVADDGHLFISVAANATYIMDADIIYYSATAVDIMAGFSAPAGASMEWSSWAPSEGHTTTTYEGIVKFESRNIGQTQSWGGTGGIVHAMPRGALQTGGTAGTLRFRWAQRVSNTDTSIVYAKSWIRLQRVA